MNNILIAKETKRIIKEGQYELAGDIIKLPTIDKQPPHTRDFSRELGGSSCNSLPHMV